MMTSLATGPEVMKYIAIAVFAFIMAMMFGAVFLGPESRR